MGVLDKFAEKVGNAIVKSNSNGKTVTDLVPLARAMAQNMGLRYVESGSLPVDPNTGAPFGSGLPLQVRRINNLNSEGTVSPRRNEFLISQNIQTQPTRLVPFETLRNAAEGIDIIRKCIQVNKTKLCGLKWDIVLAEDASEKIVKEKGGNHTRAMVEARDEFSDEITRCREFMKMPDRKNGTLFVDWLGMAIEEQQVLDALPIYPLKTVGGDLHSLQIIDGATIKPLIDDDGFKPQPPYPAFQQILYGLPRSEFSAAIPDEKADGVFTASEMIYLVRNQRTWTNYGLPPVEQALAAGDIYLRRQQWVRMEFTDGSVPQMLFEADSSFTPQQIQDYEDILNNQLAGQTQERVRMKIITAGLKPYEPVGFAEKYNNAMDESYSIAICGFFQVMPTEVGITPKGGLGGKGHQEGEAASSEVIGLVPLAEWFGTQISQILYSYLGMPRELQFKFMNSAREDIKSIAEANDIEMRGGKTSINEGRARAGQPLIDSPQADMPMLVAGQSVLILTDEGWKNAVEPAPQSAFGNNPVDSNAVTDEQVLGGKKPKAEPTPVQKSDDELRRYIRWVRKSPTREFNFEHTPHAYAQMLNKCVKHGDYEMGVYLAEQYIS